MPAISFGVKLAKAVGTDIHKYKIIKFISNTPVGPLLDKFIMLRCDFTGTATHPFFRNIYVPLNAFVVKWGIEIKL